MRSVVALFILFHTLNHHELPNSLGQLLRRALTNEVMKRMK